LGTGKTLLLVILAYFQKRKIVTNFDLNFPKEFDIEQFDEDKFLRCEYENCIILLDEAYTYLESRISGSDLNRNMSYILFQSRKKNVELYITAQLLHTIDKRFRELSDIFIIASLNSTISFDYVLFTKTDSYTFRIKYEARLVFGQFYDTNQVIQPTNKKMLFDIQEPEEKTDEIKNYAEIIQNHYLNEGLEKVTKSMIDLYITEHSKEIPSFLSKEIFGRISLENKKKRRKTDEQS